MSGGSIDRRAALTLAGVSVAAGIAPVQAVVRPASGVLLFDPNLPDARAAAASAFGQRLVALQGDPVRLWRDRMRGHPGPVHGITRWSDYLLLSELAAEQGLRITHEQRIAVPGAAMLVRWTAA